MVNKFTLLATTFPGLGGVARSEIETVFGNDVRFSKTETTRAYDLIFFEFNGVPEKLLSLRTVEDVYWVMAEVLLSGDRSDLSQLPKLRLPGVLGVVAFIRQLRGGKISKRPSFRTVVQAEDETWRKYRRVDMAKALAQSALKQLPGWRLVDDNADVELWAQQAGRKLIVSVRLSEADLRHRDYKESNRPAALRPTVAAALCWLSEPTDDDVFLDSMCGSGTILIERALMGRYKQLLGGDIDAEAVRATIENFGPKHKPWDIQRWDARKLPLEDQSVDAVVTNPPWGRQIGREADNVALYKAMMSEIARVLKPDGRAVLITSQWELLKKTLGQLGSLKSQRVIKNVSVLGWHADIFVLRKDQAHT